VEEGGEEVLGLAQRLTLHRTQTLNSLHQGREFLLGGERGDYPATRRVVGVGLALPCR
jgi:hypothetical protein